MHSLLLERNCNSGTTLIKEQVIPVPLGKENYLFVLKLHWNRNMWLKIFWNYLLNCKTQLLQILLFSWTITLSKVLSHFCLYDIPSKIIILDFGMMKPFFWDWETQSRNVYFQRLFRGFSAIFHQFWQMIPPTFSSYW